MEIYECILAQEGKILNWLFSRKRLIILIPHIANWFVADASCNWVKQVNLSPKSSSIADGHTCSTTEQTVVDSQQNRRMIHQPSVALQHTSIAILPAYIDYMIGLPQNGTILFLHWSRPLDFLIFAGQCTAELQRRFFLFEVKDDLTGPEVCPLGHAR